MLYSSTNFLKKKRVIIQNNALFVYHSASSDERQNTIIFNAKDIAGHICHYFFFSIRVVRSTKIQKQIRNSRVLRKHAIDEFKDDFVLYLCYIEANIGLCRDTLELTR